MTIGSEGFQDKVVEEETSQAEAEIVECKGMGMKTMSPLTFIA